MNSIVSRITKTVAAAAMAVTLAAALAPAPTLADGIEVGFSVGNPMDNVYGADLAMRYGDVEIHSQAYHDDRWGTLVRSDEFAHNLHLEDQHACMYVKKVEALLRQMYENLEHYKTYSNHDLRTQAIASERADIRHWEAELVTAKKACKRWF